ncbi:hypothetical protein NJB14197_47750 [Mycobacterium montefiorense]|uniref:Uncharacterized protein n=1 Tax=Mycobacterium montefiorense TaxID=154654 RepID=A0AA37PLL1_9MYCO|nr:hypothetical protein MmonteBS_45450 [Mycobacterium montefiorense]GKU35302.1 hypothetical protein NJB14191_26480 [Mycobacterium montefiorense]GKU40256.1 hypothetical protein NJB14192_22430 [Mycobacterium montefiorense]GKU46195.1 hypothetical protein NJB14194_28150 [Mycobacterium montefiorense]GKU53067.1 hypothetical protein NJB14195_43080 [Mycobacterium montefiorense]
MRYAGPAVNGKQRTTRPTADALEPNIPARDRDGPLRLSHGWPPPPTSDEQWHEIVVGESGGEPGGGGSSCN